MKRFALFLTAAALAIGLTACSGVTGFDATLYVRGLLDEYYKETFDEEYLRLVGSTRKEAQGQYDAALEAEYRFFCAQFSIDDSQLEDELVDDLRGLVAGLMAAARYELSAAAALEKDEFAVRVTVRPLTTLFEVMEDDYDALVDELNERYELLNAEALAAMPRRDREQTLREYETAWAEGVLKRVAARTAAYGDPVVRLVRVYPDGADGYVIDNRDLADVNALLLPYSR